MLKNKKILIVFIILGNFFTTMNANGAKSKYKVKKSIKQEQTTTDKTKILNKSTKKKKNILNKNNHSNKLKKKNKIPKILNPKIENTNNSKLSPESIFCPENEMANNSKIDMESLSFSKKEIKGGFFDYNNNSFKNEKKEITGLINSIDTFVDKNEIVDKLNKLNKITEENSQKLNKIIEKYKDIKPNEIKITEYEEDELLLILRSCIKMIMDEIYPLRNIKYLNTTENSHEAKLKDYYHKIYEKNEKILTDLDNFVYMAKKKEIAVFENGLKDITKKIEKSTNNNPWDLNDELLNIYDLMYEMHKTTVLLYQIGIGINGKCETLFMNDIIKLYSKYIRTWKIKMTKKIDENKINLKNILSKLKNIYDPNLTYEEKTDSKRILFEKFYDHKKNFYEKIIVEIKNLYHMIEGYGMDFEIEKIKDLKEFYEFLINEKKLAEYYLKEIETELKYLGIEIKDSYSEKFNEIKKTIEELNKNDNNFKNNSKLKTFEEQVNLAEQEIEKYNYFKTNFYRKKEYKPKTCILIRPKKNISINSLDKEVKNIQQLIQKYYYLPLFENERLKEKSITDLDSLDRTRKILEAKIDNIYENGESYVNNLAKIRQVNKTLTEIKNIIEKMYKNINRPEIIKLNKEYYDIEYSKFNDIKDNLDYLKIRTIKLIRYFKNKEQKLRKNMRSVSCENIFKNYKKQENQTQNNFKELIEFIEKQKEDTAKIKEAMKEKLKNNEEPKIKKEIEKIEKVEENIDVATNYFNEIFKNIGSNEKKDKIKNTPQNINTQQNVNLNNKKLKDFTLEELIAKYKEIEYNTKKYLEQYLKNHINYLMKTEKELPKKKSSKIKEIKNKIDIYNKIYNNLSPDRKKHNIDNMIGKIEESKNTLIETKDIFERFLNLKEKKNLSITKKNLAATVKSEVDKEIAILKNKEKELEKMLVTNLNDIEIKKKLDTFKEYEENENKIRNNRMIKYIEKLEKTIKSKSETNEHKKLKEMIKKLKEKFINYFEYKQNNKFEKIKNTIKEKPVNKYNFLTNIKNKKKFKNL